MSDDLRIINSQEYTPEYAHDFITTVRKNTREFRPLDNEIFAAMRNKLPPNWSDEQIVAVWHFLVNQRSCRAAINLHRVPSKVLAEVDSENLTELSRHYGVPPLRLVKKALITQGIPKRIAEQIILEPYLIEDNNVHSLVVRGWDEDAENPILNKIWSEKSREYEVDVEHQFRQIELSFQTQEELVREQTVEHGRAIMTPDFLFPKPLTILVVHPDGTETSHSIHWIDVKNYMFLGASFITKSLREQADKYTQTFGAGAFMFHYGFVSGYSFGSTIMLSCPTEKIGTSQ